MTQSDTAAAAIRCVQIERVADRRRTMLPMLQTFTQNRRRLLGSAAVTMLAAHLGQTGSARAQTAK